MIVVRDIFQAKYGRSGELVELFKEANQHWMHGYGTRILTDASGSFFTVVTETEVASLAEWEEFSEEVFTLPEFGNWFGQMSELVETGHREFYNVAE
jgi:hypothetical protein